MARGENSGEGERDSIFLFFLSVQARKMCVRGRRGEGKK